MKACSRCHVTKPLDEFYRRTGSRDGRRANCKTCHDRMVYPPRTPEPVPPPLAVDWREFAACIGKPELFYTDATMKEAQAICNECPVIVHCKQARLQYERRFKSGHPGIWAGEYWVVRNNVRMSARARKRA